MAYRSAVSGEAAAPTGREGSATPALPQAIEDRLAEYRAVRRQLEERILPLATSVDGRHFQFQASLFGLAFQAGGYIVLDDDDGSTARLGQIMTIALHTTEVDNPVAANSRIAIRAAVGEGIVLDGDYGPFHDATLRLATPAEVRGWTDAIRPGRAVLEIGELLHAAAVPAALDAGGFNRHTFLCGQSGSGKTYSLGLVLERLLLETGLRVVILDPNSDYVRLAEPRAGVDGALTARYAEAARGIAVRGGDTAGAEPIMLRFDELSPAAQAGVLRLDPVANREEYAALSEILDARQAGQPLVTGLEDLLGSELPGARQLALRAANLGVLGWSIWARGRSGSLVEEIRRREARYTVVDIGSLDTRQEQRVVAEAVLSTLWEHRLDREPVLIVIDEAHNVCPAEPDDAITDQAVDHVVRIAAEGRKYGLYLLVSTQRPQKVHHNVLSQCDNLVLMRMNSAADLEFLRTVFSFVPAGLLDRVTTFQQGEALVAGRIGSHAAHVRFGARVAEEGGADVPASWAARTGP
jgi:hypothetical protein